MRPLSRSSDRFVAASAADVVFMLMKAHNLLKSELQTPETLHVVFEAFDAAWAEMEAEYPEGHELRDAVRQQVAMMMLSFVTDTTRDAQKLKDLTLSAMKKRSAG
jgi:hypothetical protein